MNFWPYCLFVRLCVAVPSFWACTVFAFALSVFLSLARLFGISKLCGRAFHAFFFMLYYLVSDQHLRTFFAQLSSSGKVIYSIECICTLYTSTRSCWKKLFCRKLRLKRRTTSVKKNTNRQIKEFIPLHILLTASKTQRAALKLRWKNKLQATTRLKCKSLVHSWRRRYSRKWEVCEGEVGKERERDREK